MRHYFVISTVFIVILVISFYINGSKTNMFRKLTGDRFGLEPFDNFKYFNNISKLESGFCQPYIVSAKQADILDFIEPIWFSCNSPMKILANFTSDGILTITEKVLETENRCFYTEILKKGFHPVNGTVVAASEKEIMINPGIPTKIPFEQFVVFCRDPDGHHIFNKTFFNFAPRYSEFPDTFPDSKNYSLIILSVSGMSHNQAMRHLPKTLKFQTEQDFLSFSMFNQKSPNNNENSKSSFNEIWKIWKQKNPESPTFLHTDFRNYSSESSKLFESFEPDFQPHLYKQYNWQFHEPVENCITDGSELIEDDVILWKNFSQIFSKKSHFSILHLTEIATFQDGRLSNLDEILQKSLEEFLEIPEISKNSNIVILSDGGDRNSELYKNSETGKLEANYGVLMIRLAENFRINFPDFSENLKNNVDDLITNQNVADILKMLVSPEEFPWKRSDISGNCENSGISEKSCVCSDAMEFSVKARIQLLQHLEKLIKSEVSTQKCLSKIEIFDSEFLEFRKFQKLVFFKFHVILTTGSVKLQENSGNLKSKTFTYSGKAQFQSENNSENFLNMEIIHNLIPSLDNTVPLEKICSEAYYHQIHVDFQNHR